MCQMWQYLLMEGAHVSVLGNVCKVIANHGIVKTQRGGRTPHSHKETATCYAVGESLVLSLWYLNPEPVSQSV